MEKNYLRKIGLACASLFMVLSANAQAAIGDLLYPEDGSSMIYKVTAADEATVWSGGKVVGSFTIPSVVTSAGVDYNVTSISQFVKNTTVTSLVVPSSVKSIAVNWQGFTGCTALESITFSPGFTTLAKGCFKDCSSLSNVILPEGVKDIPVYAFQNCAALATINLPSTVTTINGNGFVGCTGLTSIHCAGATPPTFVKNGDSKDFTTVTLYVPVGAKADYEAATNATPFMAIVEEEVASVQNISTSDDVKISVVGGKLNITKPAMGSVAVHTLAGALVANVANAGQTVQIPVLGKGVYAVTVNGKTYKVQVK